MSYLKLIPELRLHTRFFTYPLTKSPLGLELDGYEALMVTLLAGGKNLLVCHSLYTKNNTSTGLDKL